MASKPHTDEVYNSKRVPKNPIKFNISLNEEQKEAKAVILESTICIIKGKAGSGKSLLAANVALDSLFKREVEKVIVTRPMVSAADEQEIGILPGNLDQKMSLYTAPVYDNMFRLSNKEKIESLVAEGKIEVIPMSMCRGRNFSDAIVIVDEAQNCTDRALEMILTRICNGTKVIICGDSAQIDLKKKADSGFEVLCKHSKDIPNFSVINLKANHRHPIVEYVIDMYSNLRS